VTLRAGLLLLGMIVLGSGLCAQAFHPPPVQRSGGGTRVGLFGFGMRAGMDFDNGGQAILGVTLDLGDLAVPRLRMRPSAEIGVGNGANTYVGSFELLFRFAGDEKSVAPYVGGGLGIAGHAECGSDSGCPAVWGNAVAGVEIRYRSTFNWLVEYHPMDLFRHNRLYLGLTTRRGN
jgi:hypothetical protein